MFIKPRDTFKIHTHTYSHTHTVTHYLSLFLFLSFLLSISFFFFQLHVSPSLTYSTLLLFPFPSNLLPSHYHPFHTLPISLFTILTPSIHSLFTISSLLHSFLKPPFLLHHFLKALMALKGPRIFFLKYLNLSSPTRIIFTPSPILLSSFNTTAFTNPSLNKLMTK